MINKSTRFPSKKFVAPVDSGYSSVTTETVVGRSVKLVRVRRQVELPPPM